MLESHYQPIIGLEIHLQLNTQSKAYCSDENLFGAAPNTKVSPISFGYPGTLPSVNEKSIEFALKLGIALKTNITRENLFARKNYFYADLPKGYQITQDTTPIATKGQIIIFPHKSNEKTINITRIHLEEDAGKSIHNQDPFNSLIDLNRAGVPLIEVVSEPEIHSSSEAYQYITEVRKLVRYLEVCDGNMEEGSMRCDANVSVMRKGAKIFGRRTEVKNINSIKNVKRAIDYEIKRQIELIESGGVVEMETRSFDMVSGTTSALRSKEEAHDYRYFPEPDILPIIVTHKQIEEVKSRLPELPYELYNKIKKEFKLSEYDAELITSQKQLANYFLEITKITNNYKAVANWLNGPIRSHLNNQAISINEFNFPPKKIAEIIKLIDNQKISFTTASQLLFPELIKNPKQEILKLLIANHWIQENNADIEKQMLEYLFSKHKIEVERFCKGEDKLQGFLVGQLMRFSKGKLDPKKANQIIINLKKQHT